MFQPFQHNKIIITEIWQKREVITKRTTGGCIEQNSCGLTAIATPANPLNTTLADFNAWQGVAACCRVLGHLTFIFSIFFNFRF